MRTLLISGLLMANLSLVHLDDCHADCCIQCYDENVVDDGAVGVGDGDVSDTNNQIDFLFC